MTNEEALQKFLTIGTDEFEELFNQLTSSQVQAVGNLADMAAAQAAKVSGYLGMRGGYGCSDQGHEEGVKEAQKLAQKVRKALGYIKP